VPVGVDCIPPPEEEEETGAAASTVTASFCRENP